MLISLLVKDYALIENMGVEFQKGLNIITGETGAGKSILIDAMGLLLGDRASTQVVRKGANKSVVEGVFSVGDNPKVKKLLKENDVDHFDELIVRREVSLKGSNRCFLNDTPTSLSLLKDIGNLLIDLHGQHEHQSLLRSSTHVDYLDEVAEIEPMLLEYRSFHQQLSEIAKELYLLQNKEKSLKDERDAFDFQIKEIDAVSPQVGEEEAIKEELNLLEHSEKLLYLTNKIYSLAYEDEFSTHDNLVTIQKSLTELAEIDKSFGDKANEAESAIAIINDISDFVRGYRERVDNDPDKLDSLRERLGALNLLKKRYGGTLEKVIERRSNIGKEFEIANNYNEKIVELEKKLAEVRHQSGEIAKKISKERKIVAGKISKEIVETLKELGVLDSDFQVNIRNIKANDSAANFILVDGEKYKFNSNGFDEIEFLISTNPGEDLKPLSKVASGGEVSRIMLALKTILANNDKLPLLIFDEIDTGVSGRIAQKVGNALKSLSTYHQIIAITHLPQIAGLSDQHFTVEKKSIGTRVVSSIHPLKDEEKVNEVAKLISGEDVTEASIDSAKELMGQKIK